MNLELANNPWDYVVKNNILAFYRGPLSQWWGGFHGQDHPIIMHMSDFGIILRKHGTNLQDMYENALLRYETLDSPRNLVFNTAEQAMMFAKAITFGDYVNGDKILSSKSRAEQKKYGRMVVNYDDEIWSNLRLAMVSKINYRKFTQHDDLRIFLTKTCEKYILAEASPFDRIWGIGYSAKDSRAYDVNLWDGKNLLGRALMKVREKILCSNYYSETNSVNRSSNEITISA